MFKKGNNALVITLSEKYFALYIKMATLIPYLSYTLLPFVFAPWTSHSKKGIYI